MQLVHQLLKLVGNMSRFIYIYSKESREDSLKDAQEKAVKQAVLAGAVAEKLYSIELVEV